MMKKFLLMSFLSIGLLNVSCKKDEQNPMQPETTSVEKKVEDLLSQMTLEEKIGQMTQAERASVKPEDVRDYFIGSILSGGGSAPQDNSAAGWANMYDGFQTYALKTRLKIPLIYGVDAVHGHNNVKGAVIFPHNIALGCTRNPSLVEKAARITAEEIAATGIDWTFAPCIAVVRNERWGRTYEGFGETPELQAMMAEAAVKGFQGSEFDSPASVLACAKHFVGDGGTTDGHDQGNTVIDEETLRKVHLPGYIAAIKAGVGSIMVSFSSWNGVKMHSHKYLLTDVLKNELGFKGFLVSDWAGIEQLPGDYKTQVATAINAGLDMAMEPGNWKQFITAMKELVQEGRIPMARVDDAVRRILRVKLQMHLFENPYTDKSLIASFGSDAHREVARQCVRESMVLLKNLNNMLPLSKGAKNIIVAGKNANDIGNQCGGWTISWQGQSGNITTGTTILQAIKNTVSAATKVTYSADGSGAQGMDFAIAVIGETPYVEGGGDRTDLRLSAEDIRVVTNLKNAGIPVVTVLVSGRPMIISDIINKTDAFMAAWLPGSEGQGVADILFGDYKPTGKLSHSWPQAMTQIPINAGDKTYEPLFEYGFGLSF
ncbi:MAG TPA: glycoside hydrolase family 3 N-terminal domain-containing protein [Ignavibacteriales bacterium]|nr:glycoside hydrolase family 3 N-terminal domain-containing protein [Ignavibacteriales bacterium]